MALTSRILKDQSSTCLKEHSHEITQQFGIRMFIRNTIEYNPMPKEDHRRCL